MTQAIKRRFFSTARIIAYISGLVLAGILLTFIYSSRVALAGLAAETSSASQQWPMGGQNLKDTRYQALETAIGTSNVSQLVVKWSFPTGAGVEASPAVVGGVVYFPDKGGNFYAVNATDGSLVWSHKISDWTGLQGERSRGDPVIAAGDELFIGDQGGRLATYSNGVLSGPGARLIAVSRNTGAALWVTQVESFPIAVITSSPVVYQGIVYIGVSSGEEDFPKTHPNYPCCSSRGSVVALNAVTGQILWKTYDMPSSPGNPGGYSGGSIWGSTPVVDVKRGSIYVGTGNNYWTPQDVQTCITNAKANHQPDSVCNGVDNYAQDYFDSIMALDLNTGAIKWTTRVQGYDDGNGGCPNLPSCPDPNGTDSDFAAGPNLFQAVIGGKKVDVLGEGQKKGVYWALDPDTGKILWHTRIGPGLGGREWGTATDGQRVYVPFADLSHLTYMLQPSGTQWNGGSWSALDPATGNILWQTAAPDTCTLFSGRTVGCTVEGAVSVANGVVYVGALDNKLGDPTMFALDAATGQILWSFASGTVVHSGPSIVGDTIYWGSGYVSTKPGKMYAFALPGS
jgi:polyvinyl alcohol dehydrogenase (cytochrome)